MKCIFSILILCSLNKGSIAQPLDSALIYYIPVTSTLKYQVRFDEINTSVAPYIIKDSIKILLLESILTDSMSKLTKYQNMEEDINLFDMRIVVSVFKKGKRYDFAVTSSYQNFFIKNKKYDLKQPCEQLLSFIESFCKPENEIQMVYFDLLKLRHKEKSIYKN